MRCESSVRAAAAAPGWRRRGLLPVRTRRTSTPLVQTQAPCRGGVVATSASLRRRLVSQVWCGGAGARAGGAHAGAASDLPPFAFGGMALLTPGRLGRGPAVGGGAAVLAVPTPPARVAPPVPRVSRPLRAARRPT